MAKDIKAIKCPHCGSTSNQELKTDFYKCQHCGTEYFLDSDDVHIYHHHNRTGPLQSSAPPGNQKLPVYILIGAIAFIAVVIVSSIIFQKKGTASNTYSTSTAYKMPRMYRSSFVYTNTDSGDPVYLRMGTDRMDKGNDKATYELHAQFNSALDGKLIADRVMSSANHSDDCSLTFRTYAPDLIYAIACNNMILQLDTRSNKLTDVTQSLFASFPELSSGVGRIDFDYSKPMLNIMNNEGKSYHYFPLLKKLADNDQQAAAIAAQGAKRYFYFGSMTDSFELRLSDLIEATPPISNDPKSRRNLTSGRQYFEGKILYQDSSNLLIATNSTAADEAPVSVQQIDVNTGKTLWALKPDRYFLQSASKCKQGFAIEYRKEAEADYVHGVMVISPSGKLVHNYELSRSE